MSGHWGIAELGELGDGYRATITWILDLLAWWFLRSIAGQGEANRDLWTEFNPAMVEGIVIIDEVEQHLHPRWQRSILKLLRTTFPLIQFIATSHSPLCALGTTDLTNEAVDLIVLEPIDGQVQASTFDPPRGKRADQILTSELFGLHTASDNATQAEIEEFAALAALDRSRNSTQESRFLSLQTSLDAKLGSPQTELERFVANGLEQILLATPGIEHKSAAVQYETLRQIRSLLD
ncbi:MAG: AAA family ATPase [Gemmataceae bacterium]